MQQAALLDGPGFDLLSSFEDGFGPSEVDIGGGEVAHAACGKPAFGGIAIRTIQRAKTDWNTCNLDCIAVPDPQHDGDGSDDSERRAPPL